jgi:hypothetical protein
VRSTAVSVPPVAVSSGWHRGSLVQGAVAPVLVVAGRVLSKDGSEVSFTDDQ